MSGFEKEWYVQSFFKIILGRVQSPPSLITRNTIFNQLSDSWSMYWYLFTLKTFWVIDAGFIWMCDVAIYYDIEFIRDFFC